MPAFSISQNDFYYVAGFVAMNYRDQGLEGKREFIKARTQFRENSQLVHDDARVLRALLLSTYDRIMPEPDKVRGEFRIINKLMLEEFTINSDATHQYYKDDTNGFAKILCAVGREMVQNFTKPPHQKKKNQRRCLQKN
jgi:hypothetical protein